MTGLLLDLARTARKETNGRKLIIFFYGYSYEFSTVQKGPAASAHYALKDLLASPDVDIICSPISYVDRQLGGGCSCMLNAESVSRAGKMYLYEDDSRTFIAHASNAPISRYSATPTLEGSVNVLLRNSGETAMRKSEYLLEKGWYCLSGSDCHRFKAIKSQYDQIVLKKNVVKALEKIMGEYEQA